MPNVGVRLDRQHVEGDFVVIEYDVTGVPAGTLIADAIIAFFAKRGSTALVWVYIDATDQPAGQVTDTGADTIGHLIFRLTDTQSALLETTWRDYTVRVKLDDGAEYTIESGDIRGEPGPVAPVQASAP